MRRTLASTLFVGLVLSISVPASAVRPVREFLPQEDEVISGICPFDLGIYVLENESFITTFFDKDGNVTKLLISGRLVVELRNEQTGASHVADISGPGKVTFTEDSEVLTALGNWLLFFFPGELGESEPGRAFLTSGRVVVEFSAEGAAILEQRGRQVDVCALLS